MSFHFQISYNTVWGENIELVLVSASSSEIIPMNYTDNCIWKISINSIGKASSYYYQKRTNGMIEKEWSSRSFLTGKKKNIYCYDNWNKANYPEVYFSSKFFIHDRSYTKSTLQSKHSHLFTIKAPQFNPDFSVCISGNCNSLGNWEAEKALPLHEISFGVFQLPIKITENQVIQYKYGIYDVNHKKLISFESGENRVVFPNEDNETLVVKNDVFFQYLNTELPRKTGVSVPVFSLRSQNSFGIGEFLDLKLLADWATSMNISLIQILPINDTVANKTWTDSYPYAAISTFALNPVYIAIENLPYKIPKVLLKTIRDNKKKLNAEKFVNWNEVLHLKFTILQKIYDEHYPNIIDDSKILKFLKENKGWLHPYAAFCVLRDANHTSDFNIWKSHKKYNPNDIASFFKIEHINFSKVMFYVFVQYYLDTQLRESIAYLHQKNVKIKGDLPIGIYKHSVEAWKEPELFGMDFQAGAPPDDFAVLGQNWEFPTYNWEKMKENDYKWWKDRFAALEKYFDAMRIDHILGFFRIWKIAQEHTQGILGFFYPAIPVTEGELRSCGIDFDPQRYCEPYITVHYLQEMFGEDWESVFITYFEENNGKISLQSQYNTQRKITNTEPNIEIQNKLLEVAANVLFLQEKRNDEIVYHPRFNYRKTYSYHNLTSEIKQKLDTIYIEYFFGRQEDFWQSNAMEKLPMLKQATQMLICGEDLGLVPKCVPSVMNDLAILSLQVQRMPNTDILYHNPAAAPYLSVVTPATHDTSTVRQWWEEDNSLVEEYYYNQLHLEGECPEVCTREVMQEIIQQHINSPAMLSVIPLQEYLFLHKNYQVEDPDDERINIPAIFPHEWKYRMTINLEDL